MVLTKTKAVIGGAVTAVVLTGGLIVGSMFVEKVPQKLLRF